jgi:hypothetical protein
MMHEDSADLPQDGQSEREAAVDAAQRLLLGPTVEVPVDLLDALVAELEAAKRLVERVRSASAGEAGTQQTDGDGRPATD